MKPEEQEKKEWEVPFSRQGRGLQNIASLVLGIQSQSAANITGFSIIMLEEPEQNLEPQMQRDSVKSVRELCGSDAQIIMATHSPYVLSSIMDLNGVQRLTKPRDGKLTSVDLGAVSTDEWGFLRLRKAVPHDMELLEVLFSPLVVIWEGDSEAGLYPALMRQFSDYPSEWLAGINAGDAGFKHLCSWLKRAGYDVQIAGDGQEGWEAIWEQKPDILITDCQMPRLDGVGLVERVRQNPQTEDLPVLMLTAKGFELSHDELIGKLDITKIMAKPFRTWFKKNFLRDMSMTRQGFMYFLIAFTFLFIGTSCGPKFHRITGKKEI